MSGCGDDERLAAFEEAIMPIVVELAKESVAALPAPYRIVAEVGIYATEEAANEQAADQDATYLLINQTIDGAQQVSVFRIDTTRKLRIDMDGRFVTEIEQNRITITADPTVDSTLVITDALGSEPVYAGSRLVFDGDDLHYDLDTGRFGDPAQDPEFAAAMDLVEPRFAGTWSSLTGGQAALRNGAKAADWDEGTPTLGGCSSLPDSAWNDEEVVQGLFSGNRWRQLFPVYCIQTSDGRYGTLTQRTSVDGEQGPLQLEYVLWKKSGD
ncbi:hypothetical protein [Micromonospora sp. NBC_01813]|uniref:hypothetical protein n=1 Tax=Micromonospora sp. NBC_01813 TaxID=2975988 RepID=UPI002DDC44F9|nr:hypothetical protein [Micromonospora sp. NBC_01813]WSA09658.1 hypothetical protein OG958_02205 [Micromonospora sp. NBC_01813]